MKLMLRKLRQTMPIEVAQQFHISAPTNHLISNSIANRPTIGKSANRSGIQKRRKEKEEERGKTSWAELAPKWVLTRFGLGGGS